MLKQVKRWGNSFAVRLTRADLDRLGVREGQQVDFQVVPWTGRKVDLTGLPVFRGDSRPFKEIREEYYRTMPERWNR